MHMVAVESSVIRAIGYNKRHQMLDVEMLKGARYRYLQVPPAVAKALFAAESKGKFYNEQIKPRFHFIRLR